MIPPSKHLLYEHSVQSPRWQVEYLPQVHRLLTGRNALRFREDFCGSGKIACEWVKKSSRHFAQGLDLDDEVLAYANEVNRAALDPKAQTRMEFLKKNVLTARNGDFDWIGAFNFSFYIFHERAQLLKYARSAYRALASSGTFYLEMAGGFGFTEPFQDEKKVKVPGVGAVQQIWEQHGFDPISAVGDYSIHFQLPDGQWLNDAFTYHWRIWALREVREILVEAGFDETVVLWEKPNRKGEGSGEFEIREDAEQMASWVAYIVGVKKPKSRRPQRKRP